VTSLKDINMEHDIKLRRYVIEEMSTRLKSNAEEINNMITSLTENIKKQEEYLVDLKRNLCVYNIQKEVMKQQIEWLDNESDATPNEIDKFSAIK
jgi:flagellar biosynthesis chaperone FliJ